MDMDTQRRKHTEVTEKLIEVLTYCRDNDIQVEGREDGSLTITTPISDEISLGSVIRMK